MRVLGVDLGLKRSGLALSDETGLAIKFLPNLVAHSRDAAVKRLAEIIAAEDVAHVVIGSPEAKTDHSKAIVSRASGLKLALEEYLVANNIYAKVHLRDEAYSSKRAMDLLVKSAVPQKKRKLLLDAAAAAVMVEDFIYWLKNHKDSDD